MPMPSVAPNARMKADNKIANQGSASLQRIQNMPTQFGGNWGTGAIQNDNSFYTDSDSSDESDEEEEQRVNID